MALDAPDAKRQKRTTTATSPTSVFATSTTSVEVVLPQLLQFGGGCSKKLPSVLERLGLRRPLIVTDPFIAQCSGLLPPILDALKHADFEYALFADCVPDPTTESVQAGLVTWQGEADAERSCDCMVAIGGGSSIDTAKAIAVLAVHGGAMRDYKVPATAPTGLPIVAIPTTAGTGSECTRFTIITDTQTDEKMLCMGFGLMPRAALVDYELTMSMPYRLTADSGLDSLCHAMEAYVSKRANGFSDTHALVAMQLIPRNLRAVCDDLSDHAAREALMSAATHAGIAFSNSSVTLIHGMSRPIGAHFHVPHGLSNAMLLPAVTEFSLRGAPDRYAECSRAMGYASVEDDVDVAGSKLVAGLRSLCEDLRVPTPAQHGIAREKFDGLLETMAEQALASGSPGNNPIVPSSDEIKALYRQIY